MYKRTLLAVLTIGLVFNGLAFNPAQVTGQEVKKDEKSKKPATVEVEKKPFNIYQSIDGKLESSSSAEIRTEFESWSDLEIKMAMPQGSTVKDGDEVLRFDTQSIDKALTEAEFALRNAEFAAADAKLALQEASQTFEMDQAIAERAWNQAQEDNKYYMTVTVPQREKDLAYQQKSSGYFLEYSKDELDQLEQMYTEDELTEESEEIVLKRAQRSVESAERSMERTMIQLNRQRQYSNPRADAVQADSFKRAEIAYQKSKVSLPIQVKRKEIALRKAEFQLKNAAEKFAELSDDRKRMTLTANATGVLFHGRNKRGKWVGAAGSAARNLEVGKKLGVDKVAMTIVDPTKMLIRCDLDEKHLPLVREGMQGRAMLTATERKTVDVKVAKVGNVALDNGKYDCQFEITNWSGMKNMLPGMSCKVSLKVHENPNAIVAPKSSVFTDDDGFSHYVYVVDGDDKPRRFEVTVGPTSGDEIQILTGLKAGQKITKAKP